MIFLSKTGKRLSQPTFSGYWAQVKAASGLNFDFYHATKHYGVHYMWVERGMSPRAVASLAGWKVSTVIEMLETYGHGDVGAMEEVDANFADAGKGQVAISGPSRNWQRDASGELSGAIGSICGR